MSLILFSLSGLAVEVSREVLAFWDSSETEEDEYTFSPTHRYIESIFNHYGLKLTFVDVNKKLPSWTKSDKELARFKGVVSWFTDSTMKEDVAFMELLTRAQKRGLSVLMLGQPGFHMEGPEKSRSERELKKFYENFGLHYQQSYYGNPLLMTYKIQGAKEEVQFERSFDSELPGFWGMRIKKPKAKNIRALMTIQTKEEEGVDFHPIIVGEKFSMVQRGFEIFTNPVDYKVKWRVNPFKLVKRLFVPERLPVPDVTTQCGRRASFIHIDGDGFINLSLIDKKSLSGEMVIEKIIKGYGFPTSASVVTAEVSSQYLGTKKTEQLVRDLYELPNVEPASHTFRHPLSWEIHPNKREQEIYLSDEAMKTHKGSIVAYMKNLGLLDYKREIIGSVKYIDESLLEKPKTKIVFWSGSCRPPEEALKLTTQAGLLNINGGDGRYDGTYSSYAGLSPLYRKIGPYIQPYSAFANENIYTNLWEGPFSGFINVIESFENTESPIRIKPINVYYHFYSGERVSSLKALHEVYKYLKKQELFFLYASDYSQIVHDWNNVMIKRLASNHWEIENYGLSRSLRIDLEDGEKIYPDYKRSKNIVGHRFHQNSLYLTLSKGKKATLFLSKDIPKDFFIKSCNGFINKMTNKTLEGRSALPFEAKVHVDAKEAIINENRKAPKSASFVIEGWRP